VTAEEVVAWLESRASEETRAGMVRYAVPTENALGVSVSAMRDFAKRHGRDHALALDLWPTGIYEARTLAVFLDEPDLVTPEQMDRWARDFDSWAICDTACFHLFDRTADRWEKVGAWAPAEPEFVRRAAFALLWALSVHDRKADDERFLAALELIRAHEPDDRAYVKKGIDMALRAVGKRNARLNEAAVRVARALAKDADPSRAWIGRHALREIDTDKVRARFSP